jgi:hypothetical protein
MFSTMTYDPDFQRRHIRWTDAFEADNPDEAARAKGAAVRQNKASARASDLAPVISQLQADGVTSLDALAKALTARGIPTASGVANWSPMQVSRVVALISAA